MDVARLQQHSASHWHSALTPGIFPVQLHTSVTDHWTAAPEQMLAHLSLLKAL